MADPRQARIAGVTNVKTVSDTNSITTRAINVNNIAPSPPLLLTAWGRLDPDPRPAPTINANRDHSTDGEMNNNNSHNNKVNDINNSDINNRNNRNTKID